MVFVLIGIVYNGNHFKILMVMVIHLPSLLNYQENVFKMMKIISILLDLIVIMNVLMIAILFIVKLLLMTVVPVVA